MFLAGGSALWDITQCSQTAITDKALGNLRGIHTLVIMSGCNQSTIADNKALGHLRGVHTLVIMSGCNQSTIADTAFENLRGIHTLNVSHRDNSTITDEASKNLRGVRTAVIMSGCNQTTITDMQAIYHRCRGVRELAWDALTEHARV